MQLLLPFSPVLEVKNKIRTERTFQEMYDEWKIHGFPDRDTAERLNSAEAEERV
jgi:hypothetical protein